MKCNVDIPYPKIRVQKKDVHIAKLLMHSYAGEISEETAIHQYLYQSFLLQDQKEEIAHILEEISKTEMYHLKILGLLIKKLGVYPVFLDPIVGHYEFWNSENVVYENSLSSMLQANIEAETHAIQTYRELIYVIDDPYIKEILKRIILDERLHLEIFETLLKSVSSKFSNY